MTDKKMREALRVLQWAENPQLDLTTNFFNALIYRLYEHEVDGYDLLVHEWNLLKSILFDLNKVVSTSYCAHFQRLVVNASYQQWHVLDGGIFYGNVIFTGTNKECHDFVKQLNVLDDVFIVPVRR
jgi:hypothetical protein